jgi:hypothetical protein
LVRVDPSFPRLPGLLARNLEIANLYDYIDFCGNMQRPAAVYGDGRCSVATLLYFVLAAFGTSTADVAGFVAETGCAVAGFLAFFLVFLAAGVALVEVFFMSVLTSDLAAIGVAAGAGAAAGAATVALAGAAGAVVAGAVVCAAAVSDTANAPAISALNNLVMSYSSV